MYPDIKYVNFLRNGLDVNLFSPEIYSIFPNSAAGYARKIEAEQQYFRYEKL